MTQNNNSQNSSGFYALPQHSGSAQTTSTVSEMLASLAVKQEKKAAQKARNAEFRAKLAAELAAKDSEKEAVAAGIALIFD